MVKILSPVNDAQDVIPRSVADAKAPLASPTFTGTVSGITKTMVGLGNVDNTSDANKPVSTAQQTALNGKQPIDADLTAIAGLNSATAGAIASDGAGWVKKTYAQFKTALALVKADVGLGNVDNTSDANKPVSTAQQTALNAKLNKAGDTLTGDLLLDRYRLSQPHLGPYDERASNLGAVSGTVNLDLSVANHFMIVNPTAALTLAFTNIPAVRTGTAIVPVTLLLSFTTVRAVTWPTVSWGAAGPPALGVGDNWITFWYALGGWYAMLSWQS